MTEELSAKVKQYIDQRILELLAQDKDELYPIYRKMRVAAATMLGAMNELSPEQREPSFVAEVPCPHCGRQMKTFHKEPNSPLTGECCCGYKLDIY